MARITCLPDSLGKELHQQHKFPGRKRVKNDFIMSNLIFLCASWSRYKPGCNVDTSFKQDTKRHEFQVRHKKTRVSSKTQKDTSFKQDTKRHEFQARHKKTRVSSKTQKDTSFKQDTKRHEFQVRHKKTRVSSKTQKDTSFK